MHWVFSCHKGGTENPRCLLVRLNSFHFTLAPPLFLSVRTLMVTYQPFPLLRQACVSRELMYIKSFSFSEISYCRKTQETVTEMITASCNLLLSLSKETVWAQTWFCHYFRSIKKVNTTQIHNSPQNENLKSILIKERLSTFFSLRPAGRKENCFWRIL